MIRRDNQSGVGLIGMMALLIIISILAITGASLFNNIVKGIKLAGLKGERDRLLRHYSKMIDSNWDATNEQRCGTGNFCGGSAGSKVIIPSGGLYLDNNLFDYGNTNSSGKWWKVSADFVADPNRWDQNTTRVIRLRVDFLRQQHPTVKAQIAPVEDLVIITVCSDCLYGIQKKP